MDQEKNNEIDLSKKLSDSTAKFKSGQLPPNSYISNPYISPEAPKIIKWVMKYFGGLIKNEKQASYFILGFVVITFIITILLTFGESDRKSPEETFSPSAEAPAEEVIPPAF
ncbi:MAG: hypothetical protein E4H47_00145 [Parcubacteria group bacterium]|nr:MAG: hypothetical protein E4H47_00145 [Parcubacteria group bacterium]